jgi:hypothetical protein
MDRFCKRMIFKDALPLFPGTWNQVGSSRFFAGKQAGVAGMGVGHQFACASLVALFSIGLLVTANLFVTSRTSRSLMMLSAQQVRVPL